MPGAPRTFAIPAKVSAVMLLLSVLPQLSFDYFQLLRIVVCASGVYIAWHVRQEKQERLLWAMIVLAILYNPISPVYFGRGLRVICGLAGAAVFWLAGTNPKRIG